MTSPRGRLFVISAPSGAGKSTLVKRLMAALPDLQFSVSWTTRPPRPGEEEGVAYHFTDEGHFKQMAADGGFLEWATVHGCLYGTGRAQTLEALNRGRDMLLDIDVQGAAQVRASGMRAEFIFILPPGRETLVRRLEGRGTETPASLKRRLANAAVELCRWTEFDYLIINDDLERAAAELLAVVVGARARRERREAEAARIAAEFPLEGQG